MKRQYFYDKQIRRCVAQLIRIFSGFQVKQFTEDPNSERAIETFRMVPCVWGNISRMGATWLNNNSENVMRSIPMMSLYITNLTPAPEYRAAPYTQQDTHMTSKQKTPDGGFHNHPASTYKISQHMPVPYTLEFNLDILVSNTNQKLEILEQLLSLFNPGFRVQLNDSPLDISRYSNLNLTNVQWSSRSVEVGSSVEAEYATLTFELLPVYINVPSKVRKNTIIQRIVTNVNNVSNVDATFDDIFESQGKVLQSIVVTPSDHSFRVLKEKDGLYYGEIIDTTSETDTWENLFSQYGDTEEGDTWIRIRRTSDPDDDSNDVYMTYEETDNPKRIRLILDQDSFNVPDLEPVDKIINPNKKHPGEFGDDLGTRYLLTQDTSNLNWGITAYAQSIVEKTLQGWEIVFDPTEDNEEHYVFNAFKNDLYYYDGTYWMHYIVGTYQPQFWMFDIQSLKTQ